MSIEHIGLDTKKVNPNGGAIALGVRPRTIASLLSASSSTLLTAPPACSSCAYSTRSAALCVPSPFLFDPLYTDSTADDDLLLLVTQQGARQIATALSEAKRSGARIICTSMCIGSGMGAASLIVAEN